ncbi:hypothetical protein GCM10028797_27280 [Dyella agri]
MATAVREDDRGRGGKLTVHHVNEMTCSAATGNVRREWPGKRGPIARSLLARVTPGPDQGNSCTVAP